MSDKEIYKTTEKIFTVDGIKNKIIVKYGFHYIKGNREPYFSITATIYEQAKNNRWVDWAGGCLHDEIKKYCPELKPLIDFHLWGQNTALPTYYIENGVYHFEKWQNAKLDEMEKKAEIFKTHILYQESDGLLTDIANIKGWLENRKPIIQRLFQETMDKFEIERIKL